MFLFIVCIFIMCIPVRGAELYTFCLSIQCYANDDVIIMYANDVMGKTLKKKKLYQRLLDVSTRDMSVKAKLQL